MNPLPLDTYSQLTFYSSTSRISFGGKSFCSSFDRSFVNKNGCRAINLVDSRKKARVRVRMFRRVLLRTGSRYFVPRLSPATWRRLRNHIDERETRERRARCQQHRRQRVSRDERIRWNTVRRSGSCELASWRDVAVLRWFALERRALSVADAEKRHSVEFLQFDLNLVIPKFAEFTEVEIITVLCWFHRRKVVLLLHTDRGKDIVRAC